MALNEIREVIYNKSAGVRSSAINEKDVGEQTAFFHAVTRFGDYGLPVAHSLVEPDADLTIHVKLPGDYDRPEETEECTPLTYAQLFGGENERPTVALLRGRGAR